MNNKNDSSNNEPIKPWAQNASRQPPSMVQPKAGTSTEPHVLYFELFHIVVNALENKIDKDEIVNIVGKITLFFQKSRYNELLLLFYSFAENNYLAAHITNNTIIAIAFAGSMNLPEKEILDVGLCAFAHDFGMKEYDKIFFKKKTLSGEENKMIQTHTQKSVDLFKSIFPQNIIQGIKDIHENVDGLGYPQHKTDFEISPIAKIVSVCDVFEALTHPRNFRKAFSPYEAIKLIIKKNGTMFSKAIINHFVKFLSIYPVGSLVHLNTGETAIIIAANPESPTRSLVRILLTPKREIDQSKKITNLLQDKMVYILEHVSEDEEKEILHHLKPRGGLIE